MSNRSCAMLRSSRVPDRFKSFVISRAVSSEFREGPGVLLCCDLCVRWSCLKLPSAAVIVSDRPYKDSTSIVLPRKPSLFCGCSVAVCVTVVTERRHCSHSLRPEDCLIESAKDIVTSPIRRMSSECCDGVKVVGFEVTFRKSKVQATNRRRLCPLSSFIQTLLCPNYTHFHI